VSLVSDTDDKGAPDNDDGKVTLMTVHGAKGLEFECVALTGMEEDLFPYRGMNQGGGLDDEELDEERRLAYVAITRARQHLIITHASQRQIFGQTRYGAASRFLRELPAHHVEELQTGAASAQTRYIDRPDRTQGRFVQKQEPVREPGERYVDREYFDDVPSEETAPPKRAPGMPAPAAGSGPALRRGMKVVHARFGEGEVRDVVHLGEPAAVAFFPGWGEMKVLARFLRSAP
jgi:DNA helicase-2/ATP-dependent DNA helicase PcrA